MSGGSRTNTSVSGSTSGNTFSRTGPNPFVSSLVPVGSTETFSALRGAEDPITRRSRELLEQTIGGDFVGGENPQLEAVFNRGADAITQRLQGDFSRSGRNIGAARPVAADELGSFRAQLDLGNLNRERQLQQAAIAQGESFNPVDQFLRRLGILSSAGGSETVGQDSSVFDTSSTTRDKKSVLDRILGFANFF